MKFTIELDLSEKLAQTLSKICDSVNSQNLAEIKELLKNIMATIQDVKDAVSNLATSVTTENQEVIDKIQALIDANPNISGELQELVDSINAQSERVSNFVVPGEEEAPPDGEE